MDEGGVNGRKGRIKAFNGSQMSASPRKRRRTRGGEEKAARGGAAVSCEGDSLRVFIRDSDMYKGERG